MSREMEEPSKEQICKWKKCLFEIVGWFLIWCVIISNNRDYWTSAISKSHTVNEALVLRKYTILMCPKHHRSVLSQERMITSPYTAPVRCGDRNTHNWLTHTKTIVIKLILYIWLDTLPPVLKKLPLHLLIIGVLFRLADQMPVSSCCQFLFYVFFFYEKLQTEDTTGILY